MIHKNTSFQLLSVFGIFLLLLLPGCIDDIGMSEVTNGATATVTVDLLVPGEPMGKQTKAVSAEQEKAIQKLQVLIFEEMASGEEVYRAIGEVTESTNNKVILKLPISDAKYRFVVLANTSGQTIADGTSKQEALNRFAFDCAGKWGVGETTPYIPMWGEYERTISIKKDGNIDILLHRALARVDVRLKFKEQTQENQTEEVEGLDNFKITSVRVYRTKNKAYVASSSDRMNADNEVITPNIHPDAKYNSNDGTKAYETMEEADNDPLIYKVDQASDKYVREIYIPESAIYDGNNKPGMDDVPCLVIGGYYGKENTSEETFYRADFVEYIESGNVSTIAEYLQVLRNYRYVFNIISVNNPGFKEPDQALNSVNVQMELTVTPWNEKMLNYYLQGDYFFQIDSRNVALEARTKDESVMPSQSVSYTTNLNLNDQNVSYSWGAIQEGKIETGKAQSEHFDVGLDYAQKKITFTAKKNNVGTTAGAAQKLSDILNLKVGNFLLTINVTQKAINVSYNLLCEETVVNGRYREAAPLDYTHYLEMQLMFNEAPLSEDVIEITSELRKGIYFSFEGTIGDMEKVAGKTNQYKLKLQGYGTPEKDPNDPHNPDTADGILTRIDHMLIQSNSITGSSCETTIIFGYKTKRILAIGANANYKYGYQLEPNTGSRAFVDTSINFGTDPNSTVTMEQNEQGNAFTIEYMSRDNGRMSGTKIKHDVLLGLMGNFKPDIILTGQAIDYQPDDIKLFDEFITDGGVFLMFNEYYPRAKSINAMVNKVMTGTANEDIGNNATTSYSNIIYQILGKDVNDPILNGPFGSIIGQQWGSDGICLHGFSNVTDDNAIIYSNREKYGEVPCVFRHKTKPFFFIGDGGFISNSKRYIGDSYRGSYVYCPFAINNAYQPVDRINYTNKEDQTVCNSRFFGNILAWAVDYAEHHGINNK